MSGRKSSEVSALLSKGKQAREAGESSYRNCINNGIETIQKMQKEIELYFSKIIESTCCISEECYQEFPAESEKLKKQFQAIKEKKYIDYTTDISKIQKSKEKIKKKLEESDRESENIRKRIQNKSHYCDGEYKDADKLVSKYKKIAQERNELVSFVNQTINNSSQEKITLDSAVQQLVKLEKEKIQMEEKAQQILELRKKAGEAKKFLNTEVETIDSCIAEKFMDKQYKQIKKKVQEFHHMSDEQVVNNLSIVSEEIGIFKKELDSRYYIYLEEKGKAEDTIQKCKELLSSYYYFAPLDYMKHKEEAEKMDLYDYLDEYSDKKDMISKIKTELANIETAFVKEDFADVEKQAKFVRESIEKAAAYASVLQENMLKNSYTALDIRNVMRKFGYEASAFMIDKNPKNGWKIEAKQGGEVINFDKVYIDTDGKVDIDIDHKLGSGGSCHAEWEEITNALDNEGIFVKSIKLENGDMVVDKVGCLSSGDKKIQVSKQHNIVR